MNDLIVLAFAVLLLLAVLPMFLMSRAFKSAGQRKGDGSADASLYAAADGHVHSGKAKVAPSHTDSGDNGDASGSDAGGGDSGGGD